MPQTVEQKTTDSLLRLIAEGTASVTGDEFFRTLVRYLASALHVRYAFVAGKLDAQLEDAMRRFLSDRSRNRYNATEVSKIFDWYSEDFERGDKGFTSVSQALGRYAGQLADDPQAYECIRSGQVEIDFLDYDWDLNDVRAKH